MAASARRRCSLVSPPWQLLLLLTLLATAAAAAGESSTVCQDASCGKGHCVEVPGIIPTYECECDPGWSQALNVTALPCTIPNNCTFNRACLNISDGPPRGIPITGVCAAANCGPGGTCKKGSSGGLFSSFTCDCQPGYTNLLNLTALPCVNVTECSFGADCSALGLAPPPASSPAPSPVPSGTI